MCFPCRSFCFVQGFKLLAVIRNELLVQLFNTLEVLCLKETKNSMNSSHACGLFAQAGNYPTAPIFSLFQWHHVLHSLCKGVSRPGSRWAGAGRSAGCRSSPHSSSQRAVNVKCHQYQPGTVSKPLPPPSPSHCQGLHHRNTELLQMEFQLSSSEFGENNQDLKNVRELNQALP